MKQPELAGRTALVTGAGRGIGRAIALALANCGAEVVVTSRTQTELGETARVIRGAGGTARSQTSDVSQRDDVKRLMRDARVDILVNNAGIIHPIAPLADSLPEEWATNIAINLNGVYLTTRFALPGMLERGWGRIVNISSGAARGGTFGWSAYAASKAAVEAMTTVLARELEGTGVTVNALRPGIVDTGMQEEIRSRSESEFSNENVSRFRGYKERGLLRDPGDPARVVMWLLSEEANDLNGQVLAIDDPEVAGRVGLSPMGR